MLLKLSWFNPFTHSDYFNKVLKSILDKVRDDDEASNIASDWKVEESESFSAKYFSKDQSQAQNNFLLTFS